MQIEKRDSSIDKVPLLYSKDFYKWPEAWMCFDEDILTGNVILQAFVPLIKNLVDQGLAKKTIKTHMDNLWLLGSDVTSTLEYVEK